MLLSSTVPVRDSPPTKTSLRSFMVGVPSRLRDGQIQVSTANYLNCRTVEFLRRWGIADQVRYHSFPSNYPNNILYLTGLNGHELARFERPANGDRAARWADSPEGPLWCPKAYFDQTVP